MMKRLIPPMLLVALALPAPATCIYTTPAGDGRIDYRDGQLYRIETTSSTAFALFDIDFAPSFVSNIVLEFPLDGVSWPSGATATLDVVVEETYGGQWELWFKPISGNGLIEEGDDTGVVIHHRYPVVGLDRYDVTQVLDQAIADGFSWVTFSFHVLYPAVPTSIYTTEAGPAAAPRLTIIPEPSTLCLLIIASFLLRRRL